MTFTLPAFDALSQPFPDRNTFKNETEAYLLLADQLAEIHEFISSQSTTTNANELTYAYVYYLEYINQEYEPYYISPEFQIGYLFNSGSPFYSFLAKQLTITKENPLNARDKFIFLSQFKEFISKHAKELEPKLKSVTVEQLQKQTDLMITHLLEIMAADIAKIVNAVPTEESVTEHLATLLDRYEKLKKAKYDSSWLPGFFISQNPNRIVYAQLAKLISTIQCKENNVLSDSMARTHQFKLGILLFIVKELGNECWFPSWLREPRSVLHGESKKDLNAETIQNLKPKQALQCLSAFRSLISSNEERTKLDELARATFKEKNTLTYIDIELDKICASIETMETALRTELNIDTNWPVTKAFGNAGEKVGAAPGYAMGWIMGPLISKTEPFHNAKISVGTVMANSARTLLQLNSSSLFTFVMGDMFIDSTISRVLALILQEVGRHAGFCIGSAFGFGVDCSYKSVHALGTHLLQYSDSHPIEMRNVDREFVQCLLLLSPQFLSEKEQAQIRYAQGSEDTYVPTKTPFS